jgi:hypothetical protein
VLDDGSYLEVGSPLALFRKRDPRPSDQRTGDPMPNDGHATWSEKMSRRGALSRFGAAGLLATASSGMLQLVGSSGALARASDARLSANTSPAGPVVISNGTVSPASCRCTGHLAKGHCDGPCPTGFFCYEVNFCGGATAKYACINCEGTPTCSYDCS